VKETSDHIDNIQDLILACRKKNKKIGVRLKHYYLNKTTIQVLLTGNGVLRIPVLIAENGVSQINTEGIQGIINSFEIKSGTQR
jgi:hypothetical protein